MTDIPCCVLLQCGAYHSRRRSKQWGYLTLTTLTPEALPRFPRGLFPASSRVVVYTVMHTLCNPLSSPGFPGPTLLCLPGLLSMSPTP